MSGSRRPKKRTRIEQPIEAVEVSTSSSSTWDGSYRDINLQDLLPHLPAEVWELIINYLLPGPGSRFAGTCRGAYALGAIYTTNNTSTFYNKYIRRKRELVPHLLTPGVHGDEDRVHAWIDSDPFWLLEKGIGKDHLNRKLNCTIFQLAVYAKDDDMCKRIEPYFDSITNGQAEKAKQLRECFPNGVEQQKPYDMTFLVNAIAEASEGEIIATVGNQVFEGGVLLSAMHQFRNEFTAISLEEVHFNPFHVLKALQLYDLKFGRLSEYHRHFFCVQVLGFMQRFMPANFIQALLQGLYFIIRGGEELERSFEYRTGKGGIVFPIDHNVLAGLGFSHFLSSNSGNYYLRPGSSGCPEFKRFIGKKEDYFLQLYANHCQIVPYPYRAINGK